MIRADPPAQLYDKRSQCRLNGIHPEAHLDSLSGAVVYGASSAPLKIHGGADADLGAGTMKDLVCLAEPSNPDSPRP